MPRIARSNDACVELKPTCRFGISVVTLLRSVTCWRSSERAGSAVTASAVRCRTWSRFSAVTTTSCKTSATLASLSVDCARPRRTQRGFAYRFGRRRGAYHAHGIFVDLAKGEAGARQQLPERVANRVAPVEPRGADTLHHVEIEQHLRARLRAELRERAGRVRGRDVELDDAILRTHGERRQQQHPYEPQARGRMSMLRSAQPAAASRVTADEERSRPCRGQPAG